MFSSSILFLTQILPYPLVGGSKTRAYYVLRQLCKDHQVTLVSFVRDTDLDADIDHLRSFCAAVYTVPIERSMLRDLKALIKSELSNEPAVILRDRQHQMEDLLTQIARDNKFKFVHADQTSMAQYALFFRSCYLKQERPSILLDQHNALYRMVQRQAEYETFFKRFIWRRESKRLAKYESDLFFEFDYLLTVSDEDKQAMLSLIPSEEKNTYDRKITTIPVCIDPKVQEIIKLVDSRRQIIHLGTMFWPPNRDGVLWFANEVFPLIKVEIEDVEFVIGGAKPPRRIRSLESNDRKSRSPIRVTGFLREPESELSYSQVFVVPLQAGGGTRVKILDAWLWGLPIVSTSIGAEGIDYEDGENILIADSAAEFADAIVRIFKEPRLRAKLRENGRDWVEKKYNWRELYPQIGMVYSSLLN